MNEAGLVANLLYLAESDYGGTDGKPAISISLWAQYVLDNFGTVAEAVAALEKEPFRVIAPKLRNGQGAQLHLAISDSTGDSAIFEYLGGKLVVHHGKPFQVMTNSPSFDQQLALESYWKQIGGLTFLPGTNRAADRFARASFLIKAIPTKIDPNYISAVPRAARHRDARRAQHLVDVAAHDLRPAEQDLLFRQRDQPERLLGAARRPRPEGRRAGEEAHRRRRQSLFRQRRPKFEATPSFKFLPAAGM